MSFSSRRLLLIIIVVSAAPGSTWGQAEPRCTATGGPIPKGRTVQAFRAAPGSEATGLSPSREARLRAALSGRYRVSEYSLSSPSRLGALESDITIDSIWKPVQGRKYQVAQATGQVLGEGYDHRIAPADTTDRRRLLTVFAVETDTLYMLEYLHPQIETARFLFVTALRAGHGFAGWWEENWPSKPLDFGGIPVRASEGGYFCAVAY